MTKLLGDQGSPKRQKNVEKFQELIHKDYHWTIHELADTTGISYGVCQEILRANLNVRHTATKSIPRLLTYNQKQRNVKVCLELWKKANKDPTFISGIITGDKCGIYGYDPETKQQSSQWKSPQSPRAKQLQQVQSSTKSMLIGFFDMKGIVHREFVPPNNTVNSDFYCVLRCLRENVQQNRAELWCNHSWLLHHDNTPTHTSLKTIEFVTNNNMVTVPHPT
jgi:hypothetical protein